MDNLIDRILDSLSDPFWWINSIFIIIGAVIVGLAEEYVRKSGSILLGKYRQSWAERNERESARWQKWMTEFINDPDFRAHAYYSKRVLDNRITTILTVSFFFLVLASVNPIFAPVYIVAAGVGFYLTTRIYFRARTIGARIDETWRLLNAFHNKYDHTDEWQIKPQPDKKKGRTSKQND